MRADSKQWECIKIGSSQGVRLRRQNTQTDTLDVMSDTSINIFLNKNVYIILKNTYFHVSAHLQIFQNTIAAEWYRWQQNHTVRQTMAENYIGLLFFSFT